MIKVFVNNQQILVPKNTSALEACESIGVNIPRFCYHERLNVAGNCRMCLVEIEKGAKPIASCASPVTPNMRIYTDTPMVQKARENVMEFLLLNHPLDCPICDQGGECDLQEQALTFGSDKSRFFYSKRAVEDKNCGLLVKTIMTRCIHCTRCVRFLQDVAGQEDFGTTLRGRETEIGTYIGKSLSSELSGNIIDLCPVGALTSKPYAFVARPWEIKSVETIDVTDSIGSNIKINFKETEILRVLPSVNDSLNEEWISDKTRFFFDSLKTQRIGQPFLKNNNSFSKIAWKNALDENSAILDGLLKHKSEQILIVCGNNADLESVQQLKDISQNLSISLVSEDFLNIDSSLMSSIKTNTTLNDILESDLCLSVGVNHRFEASLLNVRLRKRIRAGNFLNASIGLAENLTYANDAIGNSLKTLIELAEGKHKFCQKLVKAKRPVIFIGSAIKKRIDSKTINYLITQLSKHVKILDDNWLGVNFLPLTANKVGAFILGQNNSNKLDLSKIKYVYAVGVDNYDSIFTKLNFEGVFIINQTPFFSLSNNQANLVLPSTTFTEKNSTFVNLEGRVQTTKIVFSGPSLSRDDTKISLALFQKYSVQNLNNDFKTSFFDYKENRKTFTKPVILDNSLVSGKIFKTPVKAAIANFFSSTIFTKNSIVLAKCSAAFKKNYSNFI